MMAKDSQHHMGDSRSFHLSHEVSTQFLFMENYVEPPNCATFDSAGRIAIISTDRIGDSLNCIYFLANLKLLFPRAKTTYIGRCFGDPLFIKRIIGQFTDSALFIEDLSESEFNELKTEIVFDLNPSPQLFPYPVGSVRIGHHPQCDIIVRQRRENFKANEHLNIFRALGKRFCLEYPILRLPALNDERLRLACFDRPYIALCLEASVASWMVREDVANALIEYLLQTTDDIVLILGNNFNNHGFNYRGQDPRVRNLTGQLSLSQTICLIRYAELVIAVDTGLMHAASYLGTPLLAVFTCGNPARSGPQGQFGRAVVVRVVVDPPTGRWEKLDSRQSGIERRYLKLEHIIEGLELLYSIKPTTVIERVAKISNIQFARNSY